MKKYALVFLLCIGFSVTAIAKDYNDNQYSEAINLLIERGIVDDNSDFKPNKPVNRAEFLKMAMFDITSRFEFKTCFKDVHEEEWFSAIACNAKENGIISGYSDGSFRASDRINLAEALKMLMLANDVEYDTDGDKWHEGLIKKAQEMDLVSKNADAKREMNRGEVAELIAKYIQYKDGDKKEIAKLKTSAKDSDLPASHQLNVPFVSQAPFHDWSLPYAEACEEASLIMIEQYAMQGGLLDAETAAYQIRELVKWQEERNYIVDISAREMADVAKDYYGRNGVVYRDDEVTADSIKRFIAEGTPVIIPIAGQEIGNTYYTPPGPPYHVVVVTGYDSENFYVNDPGTQYGENLPFSQQVIMDGIHDWNGSKKTIATGPKAMLVLDI